MPGARDWCCPRCRATLGHRYRAQRRPFAGETDTLEIVPAAVIHVAIRDQTAVVTCRCGHERTWTDGRVVVPARKSGRLSPN